jgi:prolyl-tRNA synthetase
MSKLVGRKIKDDPKDATTASHKLLIRGGYVRPVSAGIYSLLPLAKRIIDKIEAIIREEMDGVEGQEVLMPVVLPAELWNESGRLETVGTELLRFNDRNDKDMLLAMTHEEAVVHLIRTEVTSYKQLPIMVYQIQTKYRDEARPRAGMIRVREFTMKDAYSFHESLECLDAYYNRVLQAYERIFERVGLKECVTIESDPGMMGGSASHEFMALADCGEDIVFISPDGTYKANREVAISKCEFKKEASLPLEKIATPDKETIEEVTEFLGLRPENAGKAVFFQDLSGNLIFAMIRGDFEVNEAKLKKIVGSTELIHATDDAIAAVGAVPGYASVLSLNASKVRIVVDRSIAESSNLVVGANECGFHYKNFNLERDFSDAEVADIAMVREGDPCPLTGEPLIMRRGIEVGNIFKLGTKYSSPMNCSFLDKKGKAVDMIMGCYGIGVGRTMASVLEQSHDKWGPIWPLEIAPYHVHICSLNPKKEGVAAASDKIYAELLERGVETIYDDRGEKAGFMFNDADLTGVPYRIIVSPKSLANNKVEFKIRGKSEAKMLDLGDVADVLAEMIFNSLKKK